MSTELIVAMLKDRVRNGQPHIYLSTNCLHDSHAECRRECKTCKAPCVCPCHLAEREDAAPSLAQR
jgi:hypothetical protein